MNKTGEISNNFLALLVVVAIAVALAGFMLPAKLTGYGVTGTLAADLNSTTAINFSDASIDFGAVAVPEGMSSCTIDSEDVTTCTANAPDNGFTVENIGNNNVTLDLKTGKNAATLLGGTSPAYKWKVTEKEIGACTSAAGSYVDVNTTSPGTRICTDFVKATGTDEIYIDVELTIPSDAVPGAKSDTFTATATG